MLPKKLPQQLEPFVAWIATCDHARIREAAQNLDLRRKALLDGGGLWSQA